MILNKWFLLCVTVLLMACEGVFFLEDISDNQVVLTAPGNNISTVEKEINFGWQTLKGADKYQLQIVRPNFNNLEVLVQDITLDTLQQKISLKEGYTYSWRVRALNEEFTSRYSQIRTFTIEKEMVEEENNNEDEEEATTE